MNEEAIYTYLKHKAPGKGKSIKSDALEQELGISGNELRKAINRMRREGAPIGSSKDGYFFCVTAGEVYSTIRQLRRMAGGLYAAIEGLENALDSFDRGR
jgi:biotin operon repressor